MSDEEGPKVTIKQKTKDPRRVEAGKRLAAISKAAKERKMKERIESEMNDDSGINYGYLIGGAGLLLTGISLYYTLKSTKSTESTEVPKVTLDIFD